VWRPPVGVTRAKLSSPRLLGSLYPPMTSYPAAVQGYQRRSRWGRASPGPCFLEFSVLRPPSPPYARATVARPGAGEDGGGRDAGRGARLAAQYGSGIGYILFENKSKAMQYVLIKY
jgi:hypothetical protein